MNLLLLHGALGSARQLKPLQERMGGIAIDLTGHGGSDIPSEGLSFEHFIEDIDRAFTEQNWKTAHLFGYSMGGYAALLYAAKHPERIKSVVTVGTKLLWTEEGLQKEMRKLDPDMMEAKVPAFANALAEVHGAGRWREVVQAIAKSMSELAVAPLLTPEVRSRIVCPVLLCVGDNDTSAVPNDTRIFTGGLKRARVEVLRNTRHPFEEVDLNALENVLKDFWGLARSEWVPFILPIFTRQSTRAREVHPVTKKKIQKLLVANRGEIALRVMRSAKEMGIRTVAVYSEADRHAPFVRFADEAVCIGPAPSKESYLVFDKIIQVCTDLKVDAVHPGYGFLSENGDFCRALEKAGVTFVGPSPHAMKVMGDKLAAKEAVKGNGVPLVPGTEGAVSGLEEAIKVAKTITFPILIKAAAGGGGKGMRIVEKESELKEGLERAISEAQNAFGDGSVFIEKYVAGPRHIEVQIMADTHGNTLYLFERECSIQRRHQKVVEEAPSAVLTPELRKRMGEAAVAVARSVDYTGAGTVEFLLDEKLNFYFMEMNTRLQVEHPVTEMITGLDLVKLQIRVAEGEILPMKQEDLKINGHAIEVRVYAEDPANNFLPDIGTLTTYRPPQGPGVRVDDGFEEGMTIPIHYDPMIAKLITHGATREEAIARMERAIDDYAIAGVETTLPFCRFTMGHQAFRSGMYDTHFVRDHFKPEYLLGTDGAEMEAAALVAGHLSAEAGRKPAPMAATSGQLSPWKLNRR